MPYKLKIIESIQVENGVVVAFQGLDDNAQVVSEHNINFPKRFTREQIIEACMNEIEAAAAEAAATPPDLADLVAAEIDIDQDRQHPLYGLTDGAAAKAVCEKSISKRFEAMVDASGLITKYGPVERDTWAQQIQAAMDYQAGGTVPFITAATDANGGETEAQLAEKILDNAANFLDNFGTLVQAKRRLANALAAVPDDVDSIRAFYDSQVATWSI